MNAQTPLICNMGVFTAAQRELHGQATTQLVEAVQSVQEVKNGYQFTFPNETEFVSRIAEFISNERLCCPFLKFSLDVPPDGEPICLALTGPTGTPEFLRAEFDGAF